MKRSKQVSGRVYMIAPSKKLTLWIMLCRSVIDYSLCLYSRKSINLRSKMESTYNSTLKTMLGLLKGTNNARLH